MTGRLDAAHLDPKVGWPELHGNYGEVLDKLRATAEQPQPDA